MTARILVVDDLAPNVHMLEAKLQGEYFEVDTAFSGPEALERVAEKKPDLILLDIMMPGMDGFEVCERLKADSASKHIPVVMVTALGDAESRVRGLEAGADDFLTKPPNTDALMARVRSLLRVKMTLDELRLRDEASGGVDQIQPEAEYECDFSTFTAVVIDDRPTDRIGQALSERLGMRCEWVREHAQLAGVLEQKVPDIVALNADFNKGTGLSLCRHLRSVTSLRHTAILTLLGDDPDQIAKALDAGADDYVMRPVDNNELVTRVTSQLRRKHYADQLRQNLDARLRQAVIDPLTGLHNRRYATPHLTAQLTKSQATKRPLSAMILDIDHFKQINDVYGHGAGDEVLIAIADRIRSAVRADDLTARIGGEEFLIAMPDADINVAREAANRLRASICSEDFYLRDLGKHLSVTVSIGVAEALQPSDSVDRLLSRADKALYLSKGSGRNCVTAAEAA